MNNDNNSKKLDTLIDGMQDAILNAVCKSIRIRSVEEPPQPGMPFGKGPKEALDNALELSEALEFRTKNLDDMIGFAEWGSGSEMVAALGHLDVVEAGGDWKHPPFAGEIHDDCIWGRGTVDDKGPTIGALFALKALAMSGLPLSRRIRVIFGTNEETGGADVLHYREKEELPVMAFTPDANYPVIFAEKGILTFLLSKKIYQHQGSAQLVKLEGGTASNIVPDFADATVAFPDGSNKHFVGKGLAAHGSKPELGQNAVIDLLRHLSSLDFCPDLSRWFALFLEKIGDETNGKSLGISIQDDKFGSLTLNLATMNLRKSPVQDRIEAVVDIRYPVTKRPEDIWQAINKLVSSTGVQVSVVRSKEPLYIPEDSPLVTKLQEVYQKKTGEAASPVSIGGGTYAKALPNTVAFGPVFSNQEDLTHKENERITIKHLMTNIKIMAAAMYEMAR